MVSQVDVSNQPYCICELFSPPRVTLRASKLGLRTTNPPAFDLEVGWDFFRPDHRAMFWETIQEQKPDMILMSPDCGPFSILMNVNWDKMDEREKKTLQTRALAMLHFCIQVAEYQLAHNRQFLIEQPGSASSWATHAMHWLLQQPGVVRFLFDQCMTGLSVAPGTLSRKTTAILTNHFEVAIRLSKFQCDQSHDHLQLENGRPHLARIYPPQMVEILCQSMKRSPRPSFHEAEEEEQDERDLEEMLDEEITADNQSNRNTSSLDSSQDRLTSEQKKKVNLLHTNLGHLPRERMLSLLRAAGALPAVLHYVKTEFSCEQCFRQKRPIERRKAALPRTFSFNRLIGVDFFYLNFGGKTHAFLNIVCQGTNFQQVGWLKDYDAGPPSSQETWKLFQELWLRPFGAPEALISDGGSEFRGSFERSCEQIGSMQIITDSSSPWQNGRVERHGGWLKERAESELQSGNSILTSSEDLDLLLSHLVNCKNRWFSRGGFSPCQLVFGQNPRIPLELLSDDEMNLPGLADIKTDPYDQDTAAAAFSKAHSIRQRARELCVQFNASQKVKLSTSGVRHKHRTWAVGQWVYVCRRFSGTGQGHLTRSRWIGPGVVVLQAGHTVWVSMRARLLKCNSDQLRPASSHETLGAELARAGELAEVIQQTRAGKTGAVDVAREGSPPSDAWDDQGPSASEAPIVVSPDAELPSIPEPTNPPSGRTGSGHLLRTLSTPMEELPPIPEDAQSSTRTLEEPQQEPSRQVSISEPLLDDTVIEAEIKRQRTDSLASRTPSLDAQSDTSQGRVRSQVSQMEMDRLQREAVRELRRLDRLERQQAALDRRGVASSSRDTHFSESPSISLFSSSPGLFRIDKQNDSFVAKPEKSKNGEFNLKTASPEELEGFRLSDTEEWRSILEDFKAVTVLSPQDSQNVRRDQPQRIVTSRMVRRKKPTPGVGGWKFKSRLVHTWSCWPRQWFFWNVQSNAVHRSYSFVLPIELKLWPEGGFRWCEMRILPIRQIEPAGRWHLCRAMLWFKSTTWLSYQADSPRVWLRRCSFEVAFDCGLLFWITWFQKILVGTMLDGEERKWQGPSSDFDWGRRHQRGSWSVLSSCSEKSYGQQVHLWQVELWFFRLCRSVGVLSSRQGTYAPAEIHLGEGFSGSFVKGPKNRQAVFTWDFRIWGVPFYALSSQLAGSSDSSWMCWCG